MKVKIVADAFAVESSITKEEYDALVKFNPKALSIKDDKENDLFTIEYKEGHPCISSFGITFGGVSRSNTAKVVETETKSTTKTTTPKVKKPVLTFTGMIPAGINDVKEYVADIIAPAIVFLKQLEETVPVEAKKALADRQSLVDSISID